MFKRILLGGSSALALLAAAPAYATCTPGAMAAGQDCTVDVTGGTGDINQSVADSATSPATAVKQIIGTGGTLTVNHGAGIVNRDTGWDDAPEGVAVYSAPGGTNIGTINNQGIIANSHGPNAVISLAGSGVTTINNGTTGNATIQALGTSSTGIRIGIDDGAATAGGLVLNQGSATSTGQILVANGDSAAVLSHATGDVTINNVNGVLQGGYGAFLATNGAITITNGNGTTASRITGLSGNAIRIGDSAAEPTFAPTFQVTNNAGSTIEALGAGGTAIMVGGNIGGASTILNHGTIAATGGTAIDLTGNTSANHVTVTNTGTITGNVKLGSADTLNINGGTIAGDVTGQSSNAEVNIGGNTSVNGTIGTANIRVPVTFDGDHTLTMGGGKTIYGAVTSGTDGEGTVVFSGGTNIYADLGQNGSGLKAVTLNGGLADLDNGNYYVGLTTVNSGATLGLCAANGCLSGNTLHGNLSLNGGTLDLTKGGNVTTLAAGPNGSTGAFTTTSGSVIRTAISGDGNTSGAGNTSNITMLTTTGTVTLGNGTTVTPVVNGITISNGARYILIDGTGTASVGTVSATNSALVSWSVLRGDDASLGQDAGDVYLVANKRDLTSVVTSPQSKGAATALTSIASSSGAGVQSLVNAISSLSTQAEVDQAVKQLAPSTSVAAAATSGSTAATTANINVISARSADIRTAAVGGMTGIAAGDVPRGLGLWVQGLGFSGSQDRRKEQDGYDATTGGLAFGGDMQVAKPLRIGAAFSYARTNVDAKGDSSGSGADIDSYQGTLYANYTGSPWYVDTTLVYGRHHYDSTRAIGFTGFSGNAKGDYDGNQYTAQVAGGYPLVIANTLITPNASLAYSLLKQDAYTETGAPGANLSVDDQSNTSIRSGLGMKAAKSFSDGNTRLTPELRATWFHEFRDNAPDQTARFAAGGSSFTTMGAKGAKDSAVLGVGLTIATADQVSVSANYDAELKDGYVGHNGTLQVRLDF